MRRLAVLPFAVLALGFAASQTVNFELKVFPDSPIVFVPEPTLAVAPGVPSRQFITIKSDCKKSALAVILQQTLVRNSKTEIVAIERVSLVIPPGEKRRVSIAVADMLAKLQPAESEAQPVLTIVAVEFADGALWDAPTGAVAR